MSESSPKKPKKQRVRDVAIQKAYNEASLHVVDTLIVAFKSVGKKKPYLSIDEIVSLLGEARGEYIKPVDA